MKISEEAMEFILANVRKEAIKYASDIASVKKNMGEQVDLHRTNSQNAKNELQRQKETFENLLLEAYDRINMLNLIIEEIKKEGNKNV